MIKVLVVDDDPVVRNMASELLTRRGYEVARARDWVALTRAFLEDRYQVVLLDVLLPGIDGDQMVEDIRDLTTPSPAIILHSVLPEEELRARAQECGAEGYVPKSSGNEVLLKAVEDAIANRRRGESAPPPPSFGRTPGPLSSPPPPVQRKGSPREQDDWSPRLYLVDDSQLRRAKLEALFLRDGYQVEFASSGTAALAYLETCRRALQPDVLVSDVFMPGIDGYDLAIQVMAIPGYEEIPIVLYSGSPEEARVSEATPRIQTFLETARLRGVVPLDRLQAAVKRRVETLRSLRRLQLARKGI